MSRRRHACKLIATMTIACGAWVSIAAPAGATGASTIATASELPLGSLVVGGGQPIDFYRSQLSAGDQIDIDYDMLSQPNCGYLYLFDPTVTDFNLAEAKAVSRRQRGPRPAVSYADVELQRARTLAVAIDGPGTHQIRSYPRCRRLSATAMSSHRSASQRLSSTSRSLLWMLGRSPQQPSTTSTSTSVCSISRRKTDRHLHVRATRGLSAGACSAGVNTKWCLHCKRTCWSNWFICLQSHVHRHRMANRAGE